VATERRDPEAFLQRAREEAAREAHGKLRIFFGAAAGVGKTFAMLEAAREQRRAGVDVIAGVVETHGRPETEALVEGLEILPPRLVEYRGATLKELDLDAALARRPATILVDELAHTNAPGSRHAKRWQDVRELLDAGIDVDTAMNVQHLESLNDVVGKITGIVVRETVPDSVFEGADEVELVDVLPETLRQRLKDGKVYVPELAGEAARNFFREGNLIALRELALRRTADRVDAQMQRYRRDHAIAPTWPVTERLLVCVSPSPLSLRLVRAGRRLATRLGAEWVVAYVETPAHVALAEEARARVGETLRLAERLGAETVTLSGGRMSDEILAYARARNVSQILIGKPVRSPWKRMLLGSIVDALVRGSGDIDVSVIGGEGEADTTARVRRRPRPPDWPGYATAVAVVAVSTALAWLMFPHFELANIIMTYLLGVVAVAARTGRGPAVLASGLTVVAFDFFFVPPYLTFAVNDSQYLLTFLVMLVVALVISGLTVRVKNQAVAARERERRTGALYALSRELASTQGIAALLEVSVRHLVEVLGGRVAILMPGARGRLEERASRLAPFHLDPNDLAVAQWAHEHGQLAGVGTDNLPGAQMLFVPLRAPRGTVGVLGIRPAHPGALDSPEAHHLLETFANQIALAVERGLLAEQAQRADVRIEAEELRSSLLSSVSHDLRTPLTAITGAASTLAEQGERIDADTRRELAAAIHEEADRLNRLVSNLLDMTRLQAGAAAVHREWQPLEEVVGAALGRMKPRLDGRTVSTELPPTLPLVSIDGVLIEQVLLNLLDNAAKHTPPGASVHIAATASESEGEGEGEVTVSVADRGPGLPPDAVGHVFEKFYRSDASAARGGAGLGLAICRAIVKAHGGRIWAENRPGGGLVFRFTLPLPDAPPELPRDDA
jgi:two-component system sensor histidine kinase KdpD